jgi:cytochrome oxidase Cu insertion factor (SCO1/SenC/PrrC family)
MLRTIRWAATGLLCILIVLWGVFWAGTHYPDSAAGSLVRRVATLTGDGAPGDAGSGIPAGLAIGGPVTLTDQSGKAVTDVDYRGRWMLVYFGYTFCPDVCPTELSTIASALDRLGPDAAKIAPIFITIDPDRDTPAVLADYVKLFDKRLIGLTGTPEQIHDVARAYRVYYAKVTPKTSSSYLMDHSSFAYLMSPDGRFRALLQPGESPEAMASKIKTELGQAG